MHSLQQRRRGTRREVVEEEEEEEEEAETEAMAVSDPPCTVCPPCTSLCLGPLCGYDGLRILTGSQRA